MDQKIDAFQDRFLKRCWWILGGKMEASWHQNRSKIDACCETRFFEKSCSPCSGGSIFQDSGVQVGSQNRSKIDPKTRSTWEGILAPIFLPFWWGLGAKLGGKIEPRSKKNCIENMMQNQSRFERVLDRFWLDFGLQNGAQKRPPKKKFSLLSLRDPTLSRPRPKMAPRPHFGCFWYNFWMLLARFWFDFGSVFGQTTQKDAKRSKNML